MPTTSPSSGAGLKSAEEQTQEQQSSRSVAATAEAAAIADESALHSEIKALLGRLSESELNKKELISSLLEKISKSGQSKKAIKFLFDEINKLRQDNKSAITETLLTEIGKPGKKVVVLVEAGRGSGRTTFLELFQECAKFSLKFNSFSIDDRDLFPNSVTLGMPIPDRERTRIYLGLLQKAARNLGDGDVTSLPGDWGAQYPEKDIQDKITDLLAQGIVVLRLRLNCNPEKQYERVLERHRGCPHSTGVSDKCDHDRDDDIYFKKIPDEYKDKYSTNEIEKFNREVNYHAKFLPDYHKRNMRNAIGDQTIEDKFKVIPLLEIDTNEDWPYDYDKGCFEIRKPEIQGPLARFAWFIALHRLVYPSPPTSPFAPSPTLSAMGAGAENAPRRPRSSSISFKELYFPSTTSPSTSSDTSTSELPAERQPQPVARMTKVVEGRSGTPFPFPEAYEYLFKLPPPAVVSPAERKATLSVSPRNTPVPTPGQTTTMLHAYSAKLSSMGSAGSSAGGGSGVGLKLQANAARRSSGLSSAAAVSADYLHATEVAKAASGSEPDNGGSIKRPRLSA